MNKLSIPFGRPYFSDASREKITQGVDKILSSGQLMLAEFTDKFETEFSNYIRSSFAVTINSCTSALQVGLIHYDVRGCEVLVPAAGFLTDLSVVRWAGGTPVLVDVDPNTLSFDLEDLKRKLTVKTKGIIWIHLTGVISPSYHEIVSFARENKLFLIEDCAHAHGASIDGIKAGAIGDAGCFSFYPTKIMTTGTGGILTTNDENLAKSARELRLFGRENGLGSVIREGNDWFMDEIRCCLGVYQLEELEDGLLQRRKIAKKYYDALNGISHLRLLEIPRNSEPSYYHFVVFVHQSVNYDELVRELRDNYSIPTKQIYIPLHKEKIFSDFSSISYPGAEETLYRSLCLPIYVGMADFEVDYVIDSIKSLLEKY